MSCHPNGPPPHVARSKVQDREQTVEQGWSTEEDGTTFLRLCVADSKLTTFRPCSARRSNCRGLEVAMIAVRPSFSPHQKSGPRRSVHREHLASFAPAALLSKIEHW